MKILSFLSRRYAKPVTSAAAIAMLIALSSASMPQVAHADYNLLSLSTTHHGTLNDLIRRLPLQSHLRDRELAGLGAAQELAVLHERQMSGEGLPTALAVTFSGNYAAILSALVDERISRSFGRGLLDTHRELLVDASRWATLVNADPVYGENLVESLLEQRALLEQRSIPLLEIPIAARTPILNGHRVWIVELLIWGGQCHYVNRGELRRIALLAQRLERFEGYYKRDGFLSERERSQLHERLIELQRETIDAFASRY